MGFYKKISYPDGSFYTKIENFKKEFIFRINDFNDLWQLAQIVDVYEYNGIKPIITIPCVLTGQEDKRFANNESSGLKLVCKFLNSMNADFKIFHPHNPEVVEALIDRVQIIDNSPFIKLVLEEVGSDVVLLATDAGGFKPIMKLADLLGFKGEVYGASKSRSYKEGKSHLVQQVDRQDFQGKDVLIIDDICVKGGTFVGLAKLLRERNVGGLFLAVSHITLQNPNPELFELYDKVFTTTSKFDEYYPILHKDGGGATKAENLVIYNFVY